MKANSVRIPNKNIRKLGNKILFIHILEKLKSLKIFDHVIINTDSKKIENIANKNFGSFIKVNNRPKYLQGDKVSMNKIIKYDIKDYDESFTFFQTHSTNPFLQKKTILNAINNFSIYKRKRKCDSLFSVNLIKSRLFDFNLKSINHDSQKLKRTQDLPNVYEENSNFYIFTKESFISNNFNRIGLNPKVFIVENKFESLDLDELNDWNIAKKIIKLN